MANYLDQNNLSVEADKLDSLLKSAAYSKEQLEIFDGDGDGKPFEPEDFAKLRKKNKSKSRKSKPSKSKSKPSKNKSKSSKAKDKVANISDELADLIVLANRLDAKGLVKEADYVDMLIKTSDKYQEEWDKAWKDIYKGLDDAKKPDVEWPDFSGPPPSSGTEPGSTGPGSTGPGSTDPGSTGPGSAEPGGTGPGSTDPGSTDPGGTEPEPEDGQQPEDGQENQGGISLEDISSKVKEFLGKVADWLKNAWGRIYQKYLEYKESNPGEISDPESLMPVLLQGESDEVVIDTIITITPEAGALVIIQQPEDMRVAFISAVANTDTPSADQLQGIKDGLPDELKSVIAKQGISGPELASLILNNIDPEEANRILSLLDEETRLKIIGKAFEINDLINMDDSDLKLLMSNVEPTVLATAVFHLDLDISTKISGALNDDQISKINAAANSMDPKPNKAESNEAIKKIIQIAIKLESEGKITLPKSEPGQASSPQGGQADVGSKDGPDDTPKNEPEAAKEINVRPIIAAIYDTIGQNNPEATEKMRSIFAGIRYLDRKVEDKIISGLINSVQDESIIELVSAAAESDGPTPEEIELALPEDLRGVIDYSVTIPRYARAIELSGRIMASLGTKRTAEVSSMIQKMDSEFHKDLYFSTLDLDYILVALSDADAKNLIERVSRDKALLAYKTLPERKGRAFQPDSQDVLYYHATGGGAEGERFLEDIEVMGPVKRADAEAAAMEIVNLALDLEEKGEISIYRDSDPKVEYM